MASEAALHCEHPGCEFMALNKAGLVNHTRQKHQEPQLGQCAHCQRTFNRQGLANHRRFCGTRPTNNCVLFTSFFLGLYHSASHEVLGVQTEWKEGRRVCACMCVCVASPSHLTIISFFNSSVRCLVSP